MKGLENKLELTQKQKLSFTTKMQQKLEVLRMTSSEIEDWTHKEYNENPFLEWEENAPKLAHYLSSFENSFTREATTFEQKETIENTLIDFLKDQLQTIPSLSEPIRKSALWICESLDENGYFRLNIETASHLMQVDEKIASQSLQLIQSLDPAGVGAKDISECLYLQLLRMDQVPPSAFILVLHLNRLASISFSSLTQELHLDPEEAKEAIRLIRSLNPKPGAGFGNHTFSQSAIFPDFFIESDESGQLRFSLPDQTTPRLTLGLSYQKMLKETGETGIFARDRFRRALWVIKSLEQRKETLSKIGEILLREQITFFKEGKTALRPLTQTAIAQEIRVHTSTISRALSEKWLSCSHGIFPVKFFFSSGSKKKKKVETLSRSAIKEHIKSLIQKENRRHPYSDHQLQKELMTISIYISRRTATKYREELGYPSALSRKREF